MGDGWCPGQGTDEPHGPQTLTRGRVLMREVRRERERVPSTGHRPGNTAKETGARVRRMGAEGSGSRQPSPQGTSGSGYFTDVFGHTGPSPGGTASSGGWWLQGVARARSFRGPTVQGPAHLSSVSVSANRYTAPKFIRHLGLNDDLSSAPARQQASFTSEHRPSGEDRRRTGPSTLSTRLLHGPHAAGSRTGARPSPVLGSGQLHRAARRPSQHLETPQSAVLFLFFS